MISLGKEIKIPYGNPLLLPKNLTTCRRMQRKMPDFI
jgi:hypothetical protein